MRYILERNKYIKEGIVYDYLSKMDSEIKGYFTDFFSYYKTFASNLQEEEVINYDNYKLEVIDLFIKSLENIFENIFNTEDLSKEFFNRFDNDLFISLNILKDFLVKLFEDDVKLKALVILLIKEFKKVFNLNKEQYVDLVIRGDIENIEKIFDYIMNSYKTLIEKINFDKSLEDVDIDTINDDEDYSYKPGDEIEYLDDNGNIKHAIVSYDQEEVEGGKINAKDKNNNTIQLDLNKILRTSTDKDNEEKYEDILSKLKKIKNNKEKLEEIEATIKNNI